MEKISAQHCTNKLLKKGKKLGILKNSKAVDLTTGDPMKEIINFSIPLLLGNLAQQLYNTVDAIVVSRNVGDNALAAVGVSQPFISFLIIVFVAIATGAGVLVGQYYGAKDRELIGRTISTCNVLILITSVVFTIIALVTIRPMLTLLNTPIEIFDMAYDYMFTIFLGLIFLSSYNMLTGMLRALGDSVFPLTALLVSTVINIFLDILFVSRFHWNTFGVAFATVISQGISAIMCIIRLNSMKEVFDISKKPFAYDRGIAKTILKIGFPNAITQGVFSIAMLLIQGLYNSFGSSVVTANTTVMRIDSFVMLPTFTFGIASTTFTAQNVGARKFDRVREGAVATLKIGLSTAITLSLLIFIFGRDIAKIFTDTDVVLDLCSEFIRVLSIGYVLFVLTQVFGGVMRGAGNSVTPMWISIFSVVILRTPLAYILVELSKTVAAPLGNPVMINVAHSISWCVGGILRTIMFKRGAWKKRINAIKYTDEVDHIVEDI